MRKTVLVLVIVLVALLVLPNVVRAQGEEPVDAPVVIEDGNLDTVVNILNNVEIGHVVIGAVATILIEIVQIVGARIGLAQKYVGFVALVVVVIVTVGALAAGYLGAEEQAEGALLKIMEIGDGALVLLAALGWHRVGKSMKVLPPIAWKKTA